MDGIINSIQAMSASTEDLKQLKALLSKQEDVIAKALPALDDAIAVLDPANHGLGYVFLLFAKAVAPRVPDSARFLVQCQRLFAEAAPDQVRMVASKTARIARRYTEVCIDLKQPMRALAPLRSAVGKMRSSPDQLTPAHADYLQAALLAKNYKAGAALVEEDIVDIDPASSGLQPRDLLRYLYYAGIVLTGLKEYRRALEYFRMAFTAPAVALSAIALEAYKKYLLLALLVLGSTPPSPKYLSPILLRPLKLATVPYHDLASAYATGTTDALHKAGAQHAEVFTKDRNFGLVKQVIMSLYRRNILRSTQTYLTISLADIAESVKVHSPKEAEKRILKMIEAGELHATVSQANGMVSFHEDSERFDTEKTTRAIDHNIAKIMDISAKLKAADEALASSPHYVQKALAQARSGPWAEADDMEEAIGMSLGGLGVQM
jgi:COP9 signalosome complex subunit 3